MIWYVCDSIITKKGYREVGNPNEANNVLLTDLSLVGGTPHLQILSGIIVSVSFLFVIAGLAAIPIVCALSSGDGIENKSPFRSPTSCESSSLPRSSHPEPN